MAVAARTSWITFSFLFGSMVGLYAAIWEALDGRTAWFLGLMVLTFAGTMIAIRRALDQPPPIPHVLGSRGPWGVLIVTVFTGLLTLAEVLVWLALQP